MQLAIIIILFAVTCELLALSSFDRGAPMIQVTAQLDLVSIDCGGTTNYTDHMTGLEWTSDSKGFGLENVSRVMSNLSLPASYSTWTWISSMRIFEGTQKKYCYVFDESHGITVANPYLIRATFWTGDKLPGISTPNKERISFKLLINSDEWDDIVINLPQKNPLLKEVYVIAVMRKISVCVGGGSDPAFISSLVLRPIGTRWASVSQFVQAQYNTSPKLMFLYYRVDYGSTGKDIRYPDDVYDRIWSANIDGPSLNTTRNITSPYQEKPPSAVLQTARTGNSSFNITFQEFTRSYDFYFDLYFAEISNDVAAPQQRVFNLHTITASRVILSEDNIDPFSNDDHVFAYYSKELVPVDEGADLTFNFEKTSTSQFGPLLSALELRYSSRNPMSLGTNEDDVLTLEQIKTRLQGFDSWRGDPCLPISYEWLTCEDNKISPKIIKLSLQNKGITAEIPEQIGNLQALVEIDLRGNNLHGLIPDSIAQLPNLKTLLLQDNDLSGPIPQALREKELNFSVAGNSILCKDNNNEIYCAKQQTKSNVDSKMPLVAILVSICVVVVLLVLASIFIFYFRRKGKIDHPIAITHEEVVKYSHLAQHFTSQQIERITNCFKTKLGAGGFGDVFFGTLSSGLNVAVKVSSHRNGAQEGSEFLNEVALLSRVHHRNLVEFVGYCIQPRLVLVYEYMAKGSLYDYLHGNVMVPLSWRDRLKIVVGAAQGLEYLHKGCKPPIIHRDVKCSNILLDEELEGRISDFGISRSKSANTHMTVTNVQGTVGYIAPEYAELRITEKIDVFAFGVVLLEVVSGRRAIEGSQHIINWVTPLLNQSEIQKIVDRRIAADYNMSSMWKLLEVAMACVVEDIERRPDMHEVSSELNSALSFELQNETIMSSYDCTDLPFDSVNVLAR